MALLLTFFGQDRKVIFGRLGAAILASVIALLPLAVLAQTGAEKPAKLVVGTIDIPPFAMRQGDGSWEGLSLDLLDMIAVELGRNYEMREFSDSKALFDAADAGDIDLIPALAAREQAEELLDLT